MQSFRALTQRPFALLWLGQTISRLGDNIYRVALAWWVLEKTGSATVMGLVFVFSMVPMLILLIFGGAVVDRYNRRYIMIFSDVARGITIALVAFMASYQILEVWHIFAASFIFGAFDAFFQPAYFATVPQIVHEEFRPSANSLTSLSSQFTGLVGPIIGALFVNWAGTNLAFFINAASFFLSALFLLPLLALKLENRKTIITTQNIFADIKSGIGIVISLPWLWITILLASLTNVTQAGPQNIALPFLIKDFFHADVSLLGFFGSAAAVGAVIAALWLGKFTKIHRKGFFSYIAWMFSGLFLALLGWTSSVVIAIGLMCAIGFTGEIFVLLWSNILQEYIPDEQFGRVASIDYLGSFILLPIGYALAGWATDMIGANWVFILGGVATILILGIGLINPEIYRLE